MITLFVFLFGCSLGAIAGFLISAMLKYSSDNVGSTSCIRGWLVKDSAGIQFCRSFPHRVAEMWFTKKLRDYTYLKDENILPQDVKNYDLEKEPLEVLVVIHIIN